MKHYKLDRPSKKLDNQMIGPFWITEQVRHAYQLDLPLTMKIHNMFSPDKLWKAADDPLPGVKTHSVRVSQRGNIATS